MSRKRRKPLCTDAEFREVVEALRTLCPPPQGCAVKCERVTRELDVFEALGDTSKHGRTFTVRVARDLTQQETEDTLIHEWAHVLSWRPYHPVDGDHDPVWGISFAVVYRQYYGVK